MFVPIIDTVSFQYVIKNRLSLYKLNKAFGSVDNRVCKFSRVCVNCKLGNGFVSSVTIRDSSIQTNGAKLNLQNNQTTLTKYNNNM